MNPIRIECREVPQSLRLSVLVPEMRSLGILGPINDVSTVNKE